MPGASRQRTLVYTDTEADAIEMWADAQIGARWEVGRVVLATLRYTGLRLNELVMLRLDDLDLEGRRLSVLGKGDKYRTVPIAAVLMPILERYVNEVRPKPRASAFVFVIPNGYVTRRFAGRFAPWSVEDLVRQAGSGATVVGPHYPYAGYDIEVPDLEHRYGAL